MRRLPIYLLLDTSGSMKGEPIQSVNVGIQAMTSALRQDPYALETVHLSIITFDREVRVVLPLTPLDELQVPEITTPDSGPTHLGRALEVLCRQVDQEMIPTRQDQKGDWKPLLFIMTDGSPSDRQLFDNQIAEVQKRGFANIVGCAAGPKAREQDLSGLCHSVVRLETTDSQAFASFFKWASTAVSSNNRSRGAPEAAPLPPPPTELQIVI